MIQLKRDYMLFYFEGRDEPLDEDDIDVEKLAEIALAGPDDPYTVIRRAVEDIAKPLEHDREKRKWLEDYRDEIKECGGDGEEAYRHFVKGQVDETVSELEAEVLEAMDPRGDEDEDEDDDEDDDEN